MITTVDKLLELVALQNEMTTAIIDSLIDWQTQTKAILAELKLEGENAVSRNQLSGIKE